MDSEFPDRRAIIFCMVKKFTKKIEDFNCDNCGTTVKGTTGVQPFRVSRTCSDRRPSGPGGNADCDSRISKRSWAR